MIMGSQLQRDRRLRTVVQQSQAPQMSSRRNLFTQDRRTVTQRSVVSTNPQPTSSFYGRVSTVPRSPEQCWQPGEYLPSQSPPSPAVDFHTLLSEMQSSISSELNKLHGTLSTITDRLMKLEEGVAVNTAKLSSQPSCSTPHSTPTSSCESSGGTVSSKKRKRRVPTGLSNLVRTIHNNLPEEKRLKTTETIDSEHNSRVISWVAAEIPSTEYNKYDIKKALQTYRKTLARVPKDGEQDQRLKRSRQQKKYERRGRHVKEDEMNKWVEIEPSMMSDEEEAGGQFKIHRQEWRSAEFNKLMEELDDRAASSHGKSRPRITRYFGTPCKIQPPTNAAEWMLSTTNPDDSEVLAPESPNMFDNSD